MVRDLKIGLMFCLAACLGGCGAGASVQSVGSTIKSTSQGFGKSVGSILTDGSKKVGDQIQKVSVADSLGKLPTVDLSKSFDETPALSGDLLSVSPDETYTRAARGIHRCWLAKGRPLAGNSFHAKAGNRLSKDRRGALIYVLEPSYKRQRGAQIFSLKMEPSGSGTMVQLINRRLPRNLEVALTKDIRRFVKQDISCKENMQAYVSPKKNVFAKK